MFIALHAAASPQSSQAFAQSPNRVFGAPVTEDVIGGRCSAAKDSPRAGDYFQILFNGIGQIYLVGDPIAGAFMLLGTMAYSRLIAACLCAGVIIGARFSDGIVSLAHNALNALEICLHVTAVPSVGLYPAPRCACGSRTPRCGIENLIVFQAPLLEHFSVLPCVSCRWACGDTILRSASSPCTP